MAPHLNQNRCLRTVCGAFKAVGEQVLEKETYTPPMSLYLDRLSALAKVRHRNAGTGEIINDACKKIKARLRPRRGRREAAPPTPGQLKAAWTEGILEKGLALEANPAKQRIMVKKFFLEQ